MHQASNRPCRVLISGAGIAGPTLAFWLRRRGIEPTLVEQAAALRGGGYLIDFWGAAFEVADRMGLLPALNDRAYRIDTLRLVDADGRRVGGFAMGAAREAMGGRFFSIPRGDLAEVLFRSIERSVECRFDDRIEALSTDDEGVDVRFASGRAQRFDAVVGCDGVHSGVRALAFRERRRYELPLGYGVASAVLDRYAHRDERVYVGHNAPGRSIARYALRDGRSAALFLFEADADDLDQRAFEDQVALLRRLYRDVAWEAAEILECVERAPELYFSPVSQIRVERWWRGRVSLLGDAAYAPSLLAGQGAALAMLGAYVLAEEFASSPCSPETAFARYDARLRPLIEGKQRAARRYGRWFVPHSRWGIACRNAATRLMSIPGFAGWLVKKELTDDFPLPEFDPFLA